MQIKLPTGKRKPLAYTTKSGYDFFIFDGREDLLIVKGDNQSTFFFDHCIDCNLLLRGLCSGGSPTPPSIVPNSTVRTFCAYGLVHSTKSQYIKVELIPHVFAFNNRNYSDSPRFYFLGTTSTKERLDLYPYVIGNVDDTGYLCTRAAANFNDVGLFVDTLFDKCIWNSDYSSYWCNVIRGASKSKNEILYSSGLHVEWIKEFSVNYPLVETAYGNQVSLDCKDLEGIKSDQTYIEK